MRIAVVRSIVGDRGVRIDNNYHARRIRAVVRMADHERQVLPQHGGPASTAQRGWLHPLDYSCAAEGLGENADRGFVCRRLGENDESHPGGTPPSTPVNHAS